MGLRQDIHEKTLADLELREVIGVSGATTAHDAVALMKEHGLGYVTVVDDAGKPRGVFTERSVIRLLMQNPAALSEPVSKWLDEDPPILKQSSPISKLLELMRSRSLRFVIVVDDEGKAVGVTGQRGLMEYIAEHFPRQVKVQTMESKLYMDQREGA